MTPKRNIILSALLLLTLLLSWLQPTPVKADVLAITKIQPDSVFNNVPNTIKITGSGFAPGAQVRIGGSDVATSDDLVTNYMSSSELIANLPLDYTPGQYTIYVVNDILNPLTTNVYIPAGLTVKLPQSLSRPQTAVSSYAISVSSIVYGQDFKLTVRLANPGGSRAYGLQVSFTSSELLMLGNGGVVSKSGINANDAIDIVQSLTAAGPFYGQASTSLEMNVSYSDEKGNPFTDKFTLNLPVYNPYNDVPAATATPSGVHNSQLIISAYQTDLAELQPGLGFKLELTINNMGDLPAKSVTMIVGGGSASGGGTPGPGGVSGSSGDFSNFAPLGSSNVQSLGDIAAKSSLVASQNLIVNVNTNPGAYPMKITFSYMDARGNQVNDEQVITLLVFSLPSVDVGFYQPVVDLYTNQSNILPLQIINLGRKTAIMGNMLVTSPAGTIENGQTFVGSLEPGGYFTLDAMLTPFSAGPVDVTVTIDYTDDFNTSRTITRTLTVNVVDMMIDPSIDPNNPNGGGGIIIPIEQPETIWQKIWRFVLGLFGLDSSAPSSNGSDSVPTEPAFPLPVPNIKPSGGKG
jgi:hypothetical protein